MTITILEIVLMKGCKMDENKVIKVEAKVDGYPQIGLDYGQFTILTKEQLDSWTKKKHPWYRDLWWRVCRVPNDIDFFLSSKHKLEKEHREIGMKYKNRPLKKYDVWNLSNSMAWVLFAQLVRYRRSDRCGIPGFIDFQGMPDEEAEALWENVLDKMIYSFKEIIKDDHEYTTNEEYEDYNNRIQEGLNLFGKYYRGLWD